MEFLWKSCVCMPYGHIVRKLLMLDDETRVKPVSPALYLASVEKLSQCPTAHPVRGRQIVPPPFIQDTCSWSSAPAIQIRDFDSTTATTLSVRLFASHPGRIRVCACWTCPITRREGTAALSLCDGWTLGKTGFDYRSVRQCERVDHFALRQPCPFS